MLPLLMGSLCKAARYRYATDMEDLEQQLIKANEAGSRFKIIVTDGVFMDGVVAPLDKICDLADKYDAMVMIDECHATGFIGDRKGTLEAKGVMGRVDIITGTLEKPWEEQWEDIPLPKKKLLNCYVNVQTIYFQTLAPAIVGQLSFELLKRHHFKR
jgi:glycine C-acetyltransferase